MTRLLIAILAALSMLGALSIDAYLPALPAIAGQFSVSAVAAQQSLTVYVFAFAVMTLFYGTLSDSFGRRPVVLASLVLYLLSSVGAACANSLESLLLFRLLQGLSAGAGAVIGRAVVGDLCTGNEANRAMAYISAVFGLAPAIAPIAGGWLQAAFGWRSIFLFIAAFSFLLLAACAVFLRESLPREKRAPFQLRAILQGYAQVGGDLRFMLRSTSNALAFFGVLIYVAGAPAFVMDILHLSVTEFAWLFIPLIGGMTLGSIVAGRLSHTVRAEGIILSSFAIMFISAAANLILCATTEARIPWAIVPMIGYSFGAAAATPAMTVMALEMFPKMRGLAASFQTFIFMMLFTLGSGLIAPLLYGSAFKFAVAMAAGAVASLVCWQAGRPDRLRPGSESAD
ncbi:MAG TPA: multidrug effflux MFS transporter [Chthoniobacterales bacterium]|jgi:DHA1 family bicyclomycin/chloramphenicol resistance-like MFS transporter